MKIQRFDALYMNLAEDSVTGVSFGNVYQGNHCDEAVVLRPMTTSESSVTEMRIYLDSKGPYTKSEFGIGVDAYPVTGVKPGKGLLTGILEESDNATLSDERGVSVNVGEYVWLDVEVGQNERGSYPGIKYRFEFNYV